MKQFKIGSLLHSRIIFWVLVVLVSVSLVYLFMWDRGYPVPYLQISAIHQIIILGAEFLIIIFFYKIYSERGWLPQKYRSFILLILIANCFLAYPFIVFYLDEARLDVPKISMIQPFILPAYYILLGLTVGFAIFAHQDVKQFRSWLISKFEKQRLQDDQTAIKLAAKFEARFPKMAHTPILGHLLIKFYREGWGYVIALLGLTAIGFALRLWNLDMLPPYVDENFHLPVAKAIYLGQEFKEVLYRRSFYTVTLPVVLSFKFFGLNLWAARFPGVFINTLAVVPLYLITKRINKLVAVLAVGLYLFNPWMIAISRTVREYAYYAFYFYFVAWIMVKLYEAIPDNLDLLADYRKLLNLKIFSLVGVLIFVLYYTAFIDPLSTFKLIYLAFIVFGLLLLRKIYWRSPRQILWAGLLVAVILTGVFFLFEGGKYTHISGDLNTYFISIFFEQPIQQWYYNRPLISVFVLLCALMATAFFDQKKFALPFMALTYIFYHLSFILLPVKGDKPRYAVSIEFWHIVVMAAGLFAAYLIVQQILKKKPIWMVWVGLLLIFWNIPHSLSPSLHVVSGYEPVTGEYHANLVPARTYLSENSMRGDVLITTTYIDGNFQWLGGLNFDQVIYYWEDAQAIYDAIATHPQGWIVIDFQRGYLWRQPIPFEDFTHAGKQVSFLGWFGDSYIFRWFEDK